MKILIICTGNSCRSQMAEAFLRSFDDRLDVSSAGTEPAEQVHPLTIKVMQEKGFDLTDKQTKHVSEFIRDDFDYVITVCGGARETCPVFFGRVKQPLHMGFDDPAAATGSEQEILAVFRQVRDEIYAEFKEFYVTEITDNLSGV